MKYGYVKYTDQYAEVNIPDKDQIRMFLKNLGMGKVWVKIFLKKRYGNGNKLRMYVMFKIRIFSTFITKMSAVYATTFCSKTDR